MPNPSRRLPNAAVAVGIGIVGLLIFTLEKKRPLRRKTQVEPVRTIRNAALGVLSMAVVAVLERPLVAPLAEAADRRRRGLVQSLDIPVWLRDALAVLAMDYTIYLWHIATHKVPFLWRFHLVHHIDLDLDSSTALRFHAADMALSTPYRAAQVALIGTSPRALSIWQAWFFLSILFHHSNLRLPLGIERILALVLTTPRMHGIHHSIVRDETDSNWSSGFSVWDHLHDTFRLDVPQDEIVIGVPAYRNTAETALLPSFLMPFGHERDAWRGDRSVRAAERMT